MSTFYLRKKNAKTIVMDRGIIYIRNCIVAGVLGIYILIITGCFGGFGQAFSPRSSFSLRDSMLLQNPFPNTLEVIAEVGESLGYRVTALDKEAGSISLLAGSGFFEHAMIGKMNAIIITVHSKEEGKRLEYVVSVSGNFGTGGQEQAMKVINEFKAKLLEKVGQKEIKEKTTQLQD